MLSIISTRLTQIQIVADHSLTGGLPMLGIALSIIGGVAAALIISRFAGLFYVVGDSMEPTVFDGYWILARRFLTREDLHNGDIVISREDTSSPLIIKRVHACPGESLPAEVSVAESILPEDRFLLIGDNTSPKNGAVWIGIIERKHIWGKALLIVWPLQRMRKLR